MNWRNQLRDLGILHSLVDDLQLFWQLKAMRWEKHKQKIRDAIAQKEPGPADETELEAKFRRLLKNDADYRELRHRIIEQRRETKKICQFLDIKYPCALRKLRFTSLLIENTIIEEGVDSMEKLILLCRVSSYPYHHFIAALRAPRQTLKDLFAFYD